MIERPSAKAWLLLILLSLIWGSSFILIKKGLVGLPPLDVGGLRMLSAGVVLFPIALRRIRKVPGDRIKYLVMVGLSGSFIPAFLFAIAQTQIPSGLSGVLNSITPIFTVIIGIIVYQKHVKVNVFLGIALGFLGSVILITSGTSGEIGGFNAYALLIILATVFYAINSNVIKYNLQGISAMSITSISLGFGGLGAAVYFCLFSDFFGTVLSSETAMVSAGYVMVLGVVGTALALIIFNKLVHLTDPVFTSSVTYLIPVVALVWGVLDGERLLTIHIFGVLLTITGVYITNRLGRFGNKKS